MKLPARIPSLLSLLSLLSVLSLNAQPAFQVADLNTTTTGGTDVWPLRAEFVTVGSSVFFTVSDGIHGAELWATDGTAAGTRLVKDVCPGACSSRPMHLAAVGSQVFFVADDGAHGLELWKSDGTAAGTTLVTDLVPGLGGSNPLFLTEFDGAVLFQANNGTHGFELWRSDGTAAGTTLVRDIHVGPTSSAPIPWTRLGSVLLLTARDAAHGRELWVTDGTEAGTALVKDVNPGSSHGLPEISSLNRVQFFAALGGRVFFSAEDGAAGIELWATDGTESGTVLVKDIYPGTLGSWPYYFAELGGRIYFSAGDDTAGNELWSSDGTPAGTALVKDIRPGIDSSSPAYLTAFGGRLVFRANDGTSGGEPWATDGTEAGTVLIKDVRPGAEGGLSFFGLPAFTQTGASLVFFADDGTHGAEPWKSDGTEAGTALLSDLNAGLVLSVLPDLSAEPLAVLGGRLFFRAFTEEDGVEVWTADGGGASLLKEINGQTSSFEPFFYLGRLIGPRPLAGLGSSVVFQANASGGDLWKSDGTAAGTVALADIFPGPFSTLLRELTPLGNQLLFAADDGVHGQELWSTDGTPAGTGLLKDLNPALAYSNGSPANLTPVGDLVFFYGDDVQDGIGAELWKSDGTPAGTVPVKDIAAGSASSSPSGLTAFGDLLLFSAVDEQGEELWTSDGTEDGTVRIDLRAGEDSSSPKGLIVAGVRAFFAADDGTAGRELWATDGTEAGTSRVRDIRPGADSSMRQAWDAPDSDERFAATVFGKLFFPADDGISGEELWKSNGTEAGTVLVKDILPGAGSSEIRWLTRVRHRVFFVADDGVHGRELWVSDGSAAGTQMVTDLLPGPGSSLPRELVSMGHVLLFTATDGVGGVEPWVSNGTAAGTYRLQDLAPGALSSSPMAFTPVWPNVYFTANDNTAGFELWAFPRAVLGSTFADVPPTHWAFRFAEALVEAGLTNGCGLGNYCPGRSVNRAEAAVFLVGAAHGAAFTPPPATGAVYSDVPANHWAARWIEQLAADGLTSGCGTAPPRYCPDRTVTRAEMAVLVLRAKYGSAWTPPPATGMVFGDVPAAYWAAPWIERLAAEGIAGGCGNGDFCPERGVTRAELAVYLAGAFGLPLP
jgi:ELWxxDGT repeat protein